MKIVESTDHFLDTIYRIEEDGHCVAIAYAIKDAEVIKEALEKARIEENKSEWW